MVQITDTKSLGDTVKKVRKAQGLTQSELAAACGLGRRFLLELEAGKPTSHVGKVLHVLATLGVNIHATDRKGDL
jgi:y4mF family transcriptional regulator